MNLERVLRLAKLAAAPPQKLFTNIERSMQNINKRLKRSEDLLNALQQRIGKTEGTKNKLALAAGIGSAALPALISGAIMLGQHIKMKHDLEKSYNLLDQYLGDVASGITEEQKRTAFDMLAHFAPGIAANPALAANFIKKYAIYGVVDPSEIHNLSRASLYVNSDSIPMHQLLGDISGGIRQGGKVFDKWGNIR